MDAPCVWGEHMIQGPCAPERQELPLQFDTYILQPLNVRYFGPLTTAYGKQI